MGLNDGKEEREMSDNLLDDKPTELAIPQPNEQAALQAVRTLLAWMGEDPDREGLRDTPKRVLAAYQSHFAGYQQHPESVLARTFEQTTAYHGPVMVCDIALHSHCEHHLAPFVGVAHVAYIPHERLLGLSKLARLVDIYAKRLQTQEALTAQIAQALAASLHASGVAVIIEAEHHCICHRGVGKAGSKTITEQWLGDYQHDLNLRQAFIQHISRVRS